MYRKSFPTIDAGTLLITANRRLAQHLQKQLPEQADQITNLDDWLLRLGHELLTGLHILSEAEATYLWEQIVSLSLNEYPLLQVTSTAQLAQSAWLSLQLWQHKLDELDRSGKLETEQFVRWTQAFQRLLSERSLVCRVQLPTILLALKHKFKIPDEIILAGFDELTPLHRHFFNALGCKISEWQPEPIVSQAFRVELPNSTEELYLMARWAKAKLAADVQATLGCIVPNLSNLRNQVERIFTEVFEQSGLDFNISSARSLFEFNFIKTALDILKLSTTHNDWQTISALLNSTHINPEMHDRIMAAEADVELRESNLGQLMTLNTVQSLLLNLKNDYPDSSLSERWYTWQNLRTTTPLTATPSEWADYFKQELIALGWGQVPHLKQEEQELLAHWNNALEELAQYTRHSVTLKRPEALGLFKHLLHSICFQTSNQNSRLHILGVLEASGLNFDALWVMGLNDRDWPAAAQPNPFIPSRQQRAWLMPHASTERELQYCQQIQKRLITSTPEVILSYARENRQQAQGPSALIQNYAKLTLSEVIEKFKIPPFISKAAQIFANRQIEIIDDSIAPPVAADEPIEGGSFILKEQAICPFRAFANIRLNAFSLAEPELGLSAMTRGILAHRALEFFWRKTRTQAELNSLSEAELAEQINRSVNAALKREQASQALLTIERSRLINLLSEWLNFEKQRPPFKLIAEEASYQIELARLKLNLRIDRIDQLEDGTFLIIDYKTGNSSIANWFAERITEPQLPLYVAFAFSDASAIAFAQLQSGQMKLKGISATQTEQSGLVPIEESRYDFAEDWDDLIDQWKNLLTQTAEDFCSGKAIVDPHNPTTACGQCDLQALCRINENAD